MDLCDDRYHDSVHNCIYATLALFLVLNPIIREFYRRIHELKISRDVSDAMAAALEQVNS